MGLEKKQIEEERLRLMVFKSALELGKKVDEHLLDMYNLDKDQYTFIVPIEENFFQDGHLKVVISGTTVRGKDMFMLTDIGNYSITYEMHGLINHTSPNDLIAQLKDGIGACNSHTRSINIIMPLLYNGRQHRKNRRENLSCGQTLHELDMSGIKTFVTFDAHDQGVEHAVHNSEFDNFFATNTILENFINDLSIDELKKLAFIAPDNGATGRRNVYLNSFNSKYIDKEAGSFVKQRDFNKLIDGKSPIISHDYIGNQNLSGRTAIIIDDMISSGESMFDVIDELIKHNVSHIYLITTYALFTKGINKFNEYYKMNKFDGLYTTNLSYIPKEYEKEKWLHICDCSKLIAEIIYNLHNDLSISKIMSDKSYPIKLLEKKFENEEI